METLLPPMPLGDVFRVWLPILISPIIGSFLGLVAMRWGSGETVVRGRSRCDSCGHTLGAGSLVPVVSFTLAKGRCRHCGAAIPRLHIAVELAAIAIAIVSAFAMPPELVWLTALFGWVLLLLAAIDARTFLLPDVLTLPLLLAGIAFGFWRGGDAWIAHVAGALAGWGASFLLAISYRAWRGRDGLGGGDVKLFGAAGAWLGPFALASVALLGAITALVASFAMAAQGQEISRTTKLPFGPFLAFGIFATWILGPVSLL